MNFPSPVKTIAILGTQDHAKVAASIAEQNGYEVYFFDNSYPNVKQFGAWQIRGDEKALERYGHKYSAMFISFIDGKERKDKFEKFKKLGFNIVSLVSPSAKVSEYAEIGQGSLIVAKVYIGFGTKVGDCCIINVGTNIDFDCTIKSFVTIAQGVNIAPNVVLDDFSSIYIGANIIENLHIGKAVIAGAGAVILNNIPNDVTVVGCPARIVHRK